MKHPLAQTKHTERLTPPPQHLPHLPCPTCIHPTIRGLHPRTAPDDAVVAMANTTPTPVLRDSQRLCVFSPNDQMPSASASLGLLLLCLSPTGARSCSPPTTRPCCSVVPMTTVALRTRPRPFYKGRAVQRAETRHGCGGGCSGVAVAHSEPWRVQAFPETNTASYA